MSRLSDAPHYHYDQKLGNPGDAFTPAEVVHPELGRPELPARFVADVDGETLINTMWGHRSVPWHAAPGTLCVILGYWADGTVQLRWPAIRSSYRVEGRFPGWVVVEDLTMPMAGGGHLLRANDLGARGPTVVRRLLRQLSRVVHIGN
jgi:hypothetical protein